MTQTSAEPWTIQRLLVWTAEHFQRHHRDAPRLAAEILLSEALGCRRIDLYARFTEVPAEAALAKYRDWVRRHAAGEPVAYLVGYRDFYSHRFEVSPAVLIPRPETEQVVLEAIGLARGLLEAGPSGPVRVLDVGTGSGCIAITLALEVPETTVTGVEVSSAALEVATRNATRLVTENTPARVCFLESDLDAALPAESRFDLIVSNPPYIGRQEQGTVAADVRQHEPDLALFGGEQGSEFTARLIGMAGRRLVPGGGLVIETSPFIGTHCRELLERSGLFTGVRLLKDLAKLDRVLVAQRRP